MIKIEKNKVAPKELLDLIDSTDTLRLITTSPIIGLITLSNISSEEKEALQGRLEVGYALIESVPFLIFQYNGLSFDVLVENMEAEDKKENALTLVAIENTNKTVIDTRMLGLNNKIIECLMEDTKNIPYDKEELTLKGLDIQKRYSTSSMLNMAKITQIFK